MSPYSPSFHGPTKYSESIRDKIDETPNCSHCIDGSSNCPNASNHSGGSTASASLSPSGGSYTVSAGSTHTASVSVPSGYQHVYWYVKRSTESGLGTNVETDTGAGSTTSASFSYTFPSDASGDYVITAYTYLSDWSVVQPSYTVTVGSSSTDTTDTTTSTDTSSTTDDDDDDSSSGNSIGPASGYSDTGTAGLSYAVKLTSSGALDQVKWYLKGPGDSSATLWSTNDYYGNASESTFYYCFPGSVSGDYEFTAEVKPRSGDSYSTSFTVSVTTD